MTNKSKTIELASCATLLSGLAVFAFSVRQFPLEKLDIGFPVFALFSIFFSSFLQIHIPRTNFYFTISDTLIFTAFLIYGGEAAILLAVAESLFTSFNFKRKGISIKTKTALLNGAFAAVTTFATVYLVRFLFGAVVEITERGTLTDFAKMLCAMAFTQFLLNSLFVSLFTALRAAKSFWKISRKIV